MVFVDSHAHLDDEAFDEDREEVIKDILSGGNYFFNIGCDLKTSYSSYELSKKYDHVYAVVGVHPHEAKYYTAETREALKELLTKDKVMAIGEIGLDYHYDLSPRDVQREVFIDQINLAREMDVPIVIHTREAMEETYEILEKHAKGMNVLLHCYTGSIEMARKYLKLGYKLALGGALTFKNAKNTVDVAKEVDLKDLLIETDSPYMTPVPYRGKRNDPRKVVLVAEKLAEIKGISTEEVLEATKKNAFEFFGVKND
ncbi:TatD family hydrolase [Fenollaria sporofastidiosus]|uniref:TatD family hydrolase n=1 Tax=Fenollaria sporofastidiosus TaxID=2811778 RepID=UPI001BFFF9AC|nr:TatD family hydrolase [Fenollaria sporofastidiosus]